MARKTLDERVKEIEGLIKASPITDAELDAARASLGKLTQTIEFSGKASLIPMRAGKFGYTSPVKITVDGEETTASVTFMHPKASDSIDREHAAIHRLAEIRREEIATGNASLETAYSKASDAEKAALLLKTVAGMSEAEKAQFKALFA